VILVDPISGMHTRFKKKYSKVGRQKFSL